MMNLRLSVYLFFGFLVLHNFVNCSLFYPASSAYGIFAAIAVPLDLPHRNVFVSYNFEANYNMPAIWDIPPVFNGLEEDGEFDSARKMGIKNVTSTTTSSSSSAEENSVETTTTIEYEKNDNFLGTTDVPQKDSHKKKRALLSRHNFFHILKNKMERSGFAGEACLLRLICEANASELGSVNGVLGSILHIIFSPSSSENEDLPLSYYQAEHDGLNTQQCHYYEADCKDSILDLMSISFEKIVHQIDSNKLF